MDWNKEKCQALRLGPQDWLRVDTTLLAEGWGQVITDTDQVKDLGIIVDRNADFKP
jgi:hypothetical protein